MVDPEGEHHAQLLRLTWRTLGVALLIAGIAGTWSLTRGPDRLRKQTRTQAAARPGWKLRRRPGPPAATTLNAPTATKRNLGPSESPDLNRLAGQRVIYSYSGLQPPPLLLHLIHSGEAGGVILFATNIGSPEQIRAVIERLQNLSLTSPLRRRLLILTDQEGGEVRRLPGEPLLSEKQIGSSPDPTQSAAEMGHAAAENLASVGINVNLAPVLDIYRQSGDFIDQYQRSYSRDPAEVANAGAAFIAAQQSASVAATAKHFPGLGSASQSQNTDLGPVEINTPLAELRSIDELPYASAIAAGVKLVMLSWATYPALDPSSPAGLSPVVVHELRNRLGFRGVTITDDIDAGAVTRFGSLGYRSVQAIRAGADLILGAAADPARDGPNQGLEVMHAIASALAHHQLNEVEAQQAVARIASLRADP